MIDLNKYNVDFLQGITIDNSKKFTPPTKVIGEIEKLYLKMKDGDSVLISGFDKFNSIRAKISVISKRKNDGYKIVTREVDNGYRIFKVKK